MIKHSPPQPSRASPLAHRIEKPDGATATTGKNFPAISSLQHGDSLPDLRLIQATQSKKRKVTDTDSDSPGIIEEMFSKFSLEQSVRFNQLQTTIASLKTQNEELTHSVEHMSNRYDEFLSKISQLEAGRREDKKVINLLEERIEHLERKSKSTGVEIRNVPLKAGETKDELCKMVQKVGETIGVDINQSAVKDIYRLKSKDSSNPIIIELTSALVKDNIMENVKAFNKNKKAGEKLNTSHLGFPAPIKPIFIAESLTAKSQRLFYLARTFQKENNYKFCWTSHGIIYLRKNEKAPHIKISSERDINGLRNPE